MDLPKWLINLTGDISFSKYPMWLQYKPSQHKMKGGEVQQILSVIEPGDILLRRHDNYLNTMFTPGFWGHCGLVVSKDLTIHSIGDGVIQESMLDFCRTDSVCVLRLKNITKEKANNAITRARSLLGQEYDFQFESGNTKYYCTELVDTCYGNIFADFYEKQISKKILLPRGILNSNLVDILIMTRH
jgi:uncharacterized protein YycO